jgi:hypothetical protein
MGNFLEQLKERMSGDKSENDGGGSSARIIVRDYARMKRSLVTVCFGAMGFMLLLCLLLVQKNSALTDRINREIFVAVDNKVYKAFPSERGLDEKDLKEFVKSVCFNMFQHDQFSFGERTDLVRNLMNDATFQYIVKSFEYKGQSVTSYYKKYDARMYYSVDDMSAERTPDGNYKVAVHGRQRVVFSIGEPVESPVGLAFFIREIDRTDANMFGLYIYNFNFLK